MSSSLCFEFEKGFPTFVAEPARCLVAFKKSKVSRNKMPAKKPVQSVNEQILVEAARIYDARDEDAVEGKVAGAFALKALCFVPSSMFNHYGQDLKSYAKFLSKTDAFTKVSKHTFDGV